MFKLDDKSEAIEAVANEELLNANRDLLKDDELVIVQGKVQPDRFSGGVRLNVQQVWDLAGARCRFGKYLRVEVNGSVPPVAEVLRDFPSRRSQTEHGEMPQGLAVRLQLQRERGERRARPRRRGALLSERRRARALADAARTGRSRSSTSDVLHARRRRIAAGSVER